MKTGELDLLKAVAREAARRETRSADEVVLQQLTEGHLDVEARAALVQRAQNDPALAQAVAAHRPLAGEARQRIADRLVAMTTPAVTPQTAATAGKILPLRREWRRSVFAAGGALAMAAAVLLWAQPWEGDRAATDIAPLPAYALAVSGGNSAQRGGPTEAAAPPAKASAERAPLHLAPDAPLEIIVRPGAAVPGPVTAWAFVNQGAQWAPTLARPEVAPTGTIRLRGEAQAIIGSRRGDWRLVIVVGRPALLAAPGAAERLAQSEVGGGPGWQRFVVPVAVAGDR